MPVSCGRSQSCTGHTYGQTCGPIRGEYCDQLTNHSSPVALVKVPHLPPGLLAQHHHVLGEHHTGHRVVEGGQRGLTQPELSENADETFLKEKQEEHRLFSC